jgi:hypothetical protein
VKSFKWLWKAPSLVLALNSTVAGTSESIT